jgi:toxin ParE1/3/4
MKDDRVIHKTGLASADIEELADFYFANAGLTVAIRFIDNAERAFNELLARPGLGALLGLDELPYEDIRRWQIQGFSQLIILYREMANGIEIVRVLNASRDMPALLREYPD